MYKFTLIKVISRCIPEGGVKNFIRRSILKIKSNIPREFMINRNDIVLQVGTPNIKTLYRLRKNVGGTGKVIIIEADITNVNNLENYCKTSGFKNVIIINIAAGDYTGTAKFLLGQNPGDNRLVIDD
ncbi:MAG: hypothetical protein GTO02_23100, partial [Candidatus Dadabacteria bacterium]|nr:hypothetical protein [Candidatus Dadabacteria bacterium]